MTELTSQTPQEETPAPVRPQALLAPKVDFFESETSFLLVANLPGVKVEDLNIEVKENELSLEAPRDLGDDLLGPALFKRKLTLPQEIDADGIEASLKQGVLHITVPRAQASLARKIEVKTLN